MKIIFFGSGRFVMPIVESINEAFELLGIVITEPKRQGRGLKKKLPEIARWAEKKGIRVFSPVNPNEQDFIVLISKLKPDLFVLSSYGLILSKELLQVARFGGINIHPSLLPAYRGAAPIQRALINGETKTGITVIFMDEKIDHGDIIMQRELEINNDDNYGSLVNRLSLLARDLIVDLIKSIMNGDFKRFKQDSKQVCYAPKIKKEEEVINWQDSTECVVNLVRALSPQPGARTLFRGKVLKILEVERGEGKLAPGFIGIENKKIFIGTGDGSVMLKKIKPENKKVISGLDFINGFHIKEGELLG